MRQEHSGGQWVALIGPPNPRRNALSLPVAPIGWDLFSVMVPYPSIPTTELRGRYDPDDQLRATIDAFMKRFPRGRSSTNQTEISPSNFTPLGLEALIVTNNNEILLRKRDPT